VTTRTVLTAIGEDRPGLVEEVSDRGARIRDGHGDRAVDRHAGAEVRHGLAPVCESLNLDWHLAPL
jgi:hypothetical protein